MKKILIFLCCFAAWTGTIALSFLFDVIFQEKADGVYVTFFTHGLILLAFACASIPLGRKISTRTGVSYIFFAVCFIVSAALSVMLGYIFVEEFDRDVFFPIMTEGFPAYL